MFSNRLIFLKRVYFGEFGLMKTCIILAILKEFGGIKKKLY